MKKAVHICLTFIFAICISGQSLKAQSLLKKLQNKIEEEAVEAIFGEDEKNNQSENANQNKSNNTNNNPSNTRGEGLSSTPADIVATIEAAETSFKDKNYKKTRNSIRQAIMDVEIEIGKKILSDLPETISGLPKIEDEDEVTSTGIGFVGLVISRTYRKDDQEFQVGIGNDAGILSATSAYMASGLYATSTTTEDNQKKITFQEQNAVIEFDPDSGYKLTVPFGQSSILVTEGINFNTEKEFMDACSKIEIKKIKNQLGEQ